MDNDKAELNYDAAPVAPAVASPSDERAALESAHDLTMAVFHREVDRQFAPASPAAAAQPDERTAFEALMSPEYPDAQKSQIDFGFWCYMLGRASSPQATVKDDERDRVRDAIAEAIGGDAYDCTRVWTAWSVGTMSEDDFSAIVSDESRLYEIADAAIRAAAPQAGSLDSKCCGDASNCPKDYSDCPHKGMPPQAGATLTDEQRQEIAFALSFIPPTTSHRERSIAVLRALLADQVEK